MQLRPGALRPSVPLPRPHLVPCPPRPRGCHPLLHLLPICHPLIQAISLLVTRACSVRQVLSWSLGVWWAVRQVGRLQSRPEQVTPE